MSAIITSAIDRLIQRTSRYAPELADEAQAELIALRAEFDRHRACPECNHKMVPVDCPFEAELAALRAELDAAQRDKRVIQEHLNQNTISQAGQITALRAENERLKHQTKELEHNLNCKVRELTRIADARDTYREIAGALGKDLTLAQRTYRQRYMTMGTPFDTTLARWTEMEGKR